MELLKPGKVSWKNNISRKEGHDFTDIKNSSNTIIKQVDKGGSFVTINKPIILKDVYQGTPCF